MEDRIKSAFKGLSEETLLLIYGSGVDLDAAVSGDSADRIRGKVYCKLGKNLPEVKKTNRIGALKYALIPIVAALLLIVGVLALKQPIKDRIYKVNSGTAIPSETREISVEQYEVATEVDFSLFDFSAADRIVVYSGKTGAEKTIYDLDGVLGAICKLEGSDPVSSRGYSGFSYNIKICGGDKLLCEVGLLGVGENKIFYGIYEEVGSFKYSAVYSGNSAVEDVVAVLDGIFGE